MNTDTKLTPEQLESELAHAIGSEQYYHRGMSFYYTDGMKFLADNAGAHWLIDAIFSQQIKSCVRREEFQVWTLRVGSNHAAILKCTDGGKDGQLEREITRQFIQYTDFPLEKITLYVEIGSVDGKHTSQILLLPSEH